MSKKITITLSEQQHQQLKTLTGSLRTKVEGKTRNITISEVAGLIISRSFKKPGSRISKAKDLTEDLEEEIEAEIKGLTGSYGLKFWENKENKKLEEVEKADIGEEEINDIYKTLTRLRKEKNQKGFKGTPDNSREVEELEKRIDKINRKMNEEKAQSQRDFEEGRYSGKRRRKN